MDGHGLQISRFGGRLLSVAVLTTVLAACSQRAGWPGVQLNGMPAMGLPVVSVAHVSQAAFPGNHVGHAVIVPGGTTIFVANPGVTMGSGIGALVYQPIATTQQPLQAYGQTATDLRSGRVVLAQRHSPPMGLPPEPAFAVPLRVVAVDQSGTVARKPQKVAQKVWSGAEQKQHARAALGKKPMSTTTALQPAGVPAPVAEHTAQAPQPQVVGAVNPPVVKDPQPEIFSMMVDERSLQAPLGNDAASQAAQPKAVPIPQSQAFGESLNDIFPLLLEEQSLQAPRRKGVPHSQLIGIPCPLADRVANPVVVGRLATVV